MVNIILLRQIMDVIMEGWIPAVGWNVIDLIYQSDIFRPVVTILIFINIYHNINSIITHLRNQITSFNYLFKVFSYQFVLNLDFLYIYNISQKLKWLSLEQITLYQVIEEEMESRLHRFIGALTYKNNKQQQGKATGILIAPNLVLTSALNIYDHPSRQLNHSWIFYPKLCGKLVPQEGYQIQKYFFPNEYTLETPHPKNDYALLKLKRNVPGKYFIPLCQDVSKMNLTTAKLAIFGYPIQKYILLAKGQKSVCQYGLIRSGCVEQINQEKREIWHKVSTMIGQGGAPIIWIDQNQKLSIVGVIVGVHKGAVNKKVNGQLKMLNCGMLLTAEVINILKHQTESMGAEMFSISLQRSNPKEVKINATQLIREYLDIAQESFSSQHFEIAISVWKRVLREDPENKTALNGIGMSFILIEKYHEAVEYFKKITEITPNKASALNNLGQALFKSGRSKQAIRLFQKALLCDKWYFMAHYNLGVAYNSLSDSHKAIKQYRETLKINPMFQRAFTNLGTVLCETGQREEGIQCYKQAIQLDPNDELAFNNLQLTLLEEKNEYLLGEGVKFMKNVMNSYPDNELAPKLVEKLRTRIEQLSK